MNRPYVNWCKRRMHQLELISEAVCEEREALEYALDEDLDYDRIYQILREVRGAEYQIRRALNKLQVLKDYAEYEDE